MTDDESDDDYNKMQAEAEMMDMPNMSIDDNEDLQDSDDDLNDFNALKAKTTTKRKAVTQGSSSHAGGSVVAPKTVERDVVIDDFIRNFLTKIKMTKTMNIFQ